jgi:hypothetical protein
MIMMLVPMTLAIAIWVVFTLLENSMNLINASTMTAMPPLVSHLPLLTVMITMFALLILVTLNLVVKTKTSIVTMKTLVLKNIAILNPDVCTTLFHATITTSVLMTPVALPTVALTLKRTVMITMLVPQTLANPILDAYILLNLVTITMNAPMTAAAR